MEIHKNPGLATQYGWMSIPTLMVCKNGEGGNKGGGLGPKAAVERLLG